MRPEPLFLDFGIAAQEVVAGGLAGTGAEDGEGRVMVLVLLTDAGKI